jgi:chromosomal replication initiator protein
MVVKEDYSLIWDQVITQLSSQQEGQEFDLWSNLSLAKATESEITVQVPSAYIKDQIKSRFSNQIESEFTNILGKDIKITFTVHKKLDEPHKTTEIISETPKKNNEKIQKHVSPPQNFAFSVKPDKKSIHCQLRKEYCFDNYVIGENNRFAVNAAMAVSKNLGRSYNPLLIYGGVGLGKTHLMQAIGNYVSESSENKIIFVSAENFMNEFIESINDKKSAATFRNKYRQTDLLMIDDIHSFKNAQSTLEELFHTYDALYNANKQIVFTCDRPVTELKNLSERLESRFKRGLNVDLQPPDYETRCAIIKSKVKTKGIAIPDDVISLVSKNITSNIRDIESALTTLFAYNEFEQRPITIAVAQQQLKEFFASPKQSNISIETIQRVVADNFSLTLTELRGKKRTQNIVYPRHLAMYITHQLTEFSTTEIGQAFGGKDHTTVMNALEKIEKKVKSNPIEEATIQSLIRTIKDQSVK